MIWSAADLSVRNLSASFARSKISSISSLVRSAMDSKFRILDGSPSLNGAPRLPTSDADLIDAVTFFQHDVNSFALTGVTIFAYDIGSNWQLARTAVHEGSH